LSRQIVPDHSAPTRTAVDVPSAAHPELNEFYSLKLSVVVQPASWPRTIVAGPARRAAWN